MSGWPGDVSNNHSLIGCSFMDDSESPLGLSQVSMA